MFTDEHMELWEIEYDETEQQMSWFEWSNEVELLKSHNLDGDLMKDGYSFDTFCEMWVRNWSPEQAAYATMEDHLGVL